VADTMRPGATVNEVAGRHRAKVDAYRCEDRWQVEEVSISLTSSRSLHIYADLHINGAFSIAKMWVVGMESLFDKFKGCYKIQVNYKV
jgi:hypothetical protein